MKKCLTLLLAIPFLSNAQDCGNYLFMSNKSTVQMTIYDKKGKESGVQTWTISDVKKNGNGYQSTVNSVMKDEKGKEISKGQGVYICDNGTLKADVRMSLPQEQMQTYKDAEANFDAAYIEYPSKLNEGQALTDVDFKMEIKAQNGMPTTITFKETNRKVEKKENITTPAGTWDAYVISYDAQFKTQMGPIGIPVNMQAKEWFVPNVGVVKTETYSKGGKLIGSTQITAITK
ncbi:MAG TPA: hypothetical protein VEB42_15495 [Chitinophagaceae bacterium]|nr:hypothetical protein [Chitinophagaceae bacterium]